MWAQERRVLILLRDSIHSFNNDVLLANRGECSNPASCLVPVSASEVIMEEEALPIVSTQN